MFTSRRFALLIATGRYDNQALRQLRSPVRDAHGLAEVLEDPRIGDFEVGRVVDGRHHEVTRAVERFFLDRRRDDVLLLHLSCHGVKNDNGELHFATTDTDHRLLASTSVPAAFLHTQMRRCRARSIVLLLDCCYSGAFLPGSKGDTVVHLRDELAGHGRAVLTATNRTEYAWEGDRLDELEPQPSRFTGAVIKGLRSGEADRDGDGVIGVHELYDYVYDELQAAQVVQRPQMWAELEHRVVIARSVRGQRQEQEPGQEQEQGRKQEQGQGHESATPATPAISEIPVPPSPPVPSPGDGLSELVLIAELLSGLACMEDVRSRSEFAMVLGEELSRRVDLRGVRLREDVATMARAAVRQKGGVRALVWTVEFFEGGGVAAGLERQLGRGGSAASAPAAPEALTAPAAPTTEAPTAPAAPAPAEEADSGPALRPGSPRRSRRVALFLRLTGELSTLSCMADAQGRAQFASVLGEQLHHPVDLRGTRLRDDVVVIVRAALNAPYGDRVLAILVRLFEGAQAAAAVERLLDEPP
ncbi:caspase, EACC1-associated type [Streptomyces sp. P9-A2]|uniref:caspase, EACC1-associated type n=1 Tax=Streptomyces sp. P9-A2 TaxID=3072284 RepID=UPI002FCA9A4B